MFRLMTLVFLLLSFNFAEAEVLDKIVAVVNEQVITQSQLDALIDQMHKQITQTHMQSPGEAQLRQDALNQLIDRDIQLQLAEKSQITVSNEELNQAINSIAQQNHLSPSELKEKIQTESGLSYAQFSEQIKQQIMISKLQQLALGPKINITAAQVNKAITDAQQSEYDISDILVPLPEDPTPAQVHEAQTRAAELIKQLKSGKKVDELTTVVEETASTTSVTEKKPGFLSKIFGHKNSKEKAAEAPATISPEQISAQNLGLRKASDLPEVFVAQLGELRKTGIAGPIQTANGLHILRLNEIKATSEAPINRMMIQNQLYQQAMMKELPIWIAEVRKTAYVKIND